MKTVFIYVLKEPDTGEIRYIGKANGVQKRLMNHISDREKNHRTNWIQSLSIRGLKPGLEIIDEVPRDLDQSAEMGYIHLYKSQGCDLVNGTPGGDGGPGMAGKTHTKEWCEAASERMTGENHPMFGKHHSEEALKRMSEAATGRKASLETREKISRLHTGKVNSAATRAKMSLAKIGNKNCLGKQNTLGMKWTDEQRKAHSERVTKWWAERKKSRL